MEGKGLQCKVSASTGIGGGCLSPGWFLEPSSVGNSSKAVVFHGKWLKSVLKGVFQEEEFSLQLPVG